ncbi:MAG: bifunctional diguanylate cyclase/phosphodiesterase [Actinomycetota bacterium]|nr:bifunctional diguanylate cyclase/phosphodiesterase [Actinomycetota bacterium]
MTIEYRSVLLGPMRRARTRVTLRWWPRELREQIRGVFLVAAVGGNALGMSDLTTRHGELVAFTSAVATLALSAIWILGYRRRGFGRASEPLELALLLLVGLGYSSPAMLLGPIYNGVFFRPLYGTTARGVLRTLGYGAVMELTLILHPVSDHLLQPGSLIAWFGPSLAMCTIAARLLYLVLTRRAAAGAREQILRHTATRLLKAEDEAEVEALALEAACRLLPSPPRAIAMELEHDEGPEIAGDATVPRPLRPTPPGEHPYTMHVSLRPSRGPATWLVIESDEALAPEVRQGLDALAGQIGLGLANVRLRAELAHRALHDGLTDLPNRHQLTSALHDAIAAARHVAVVFVDLDDFKTVNDALGHEVGDGLLRAVAARLAAAQRPGDLLGRLGGDEFAAVVFDLDLRSEDPAALSGRFLSCLDAPFVVDGHELSVHCSLGICIAEPDQRAEEVLRNADTAMYVAKARGKGRAELYNAAMHEAVTSELALRDDLHVAVRDRQFVLYYQPLVDLSSNHVHGFEALIRWQHEARGLIPPDDFVPLAERLGVLHGIERQALVDACATAASWRSPGPASVSVNISPSHVQQPSLVEEVHQALATSGLDASRLIIEVTESVTADDWRQVATTLAGLRALGVRIALDDFGSGYSSLNLLGQLPVDIVKVDRHFTGGAANATVLHAVIGLARHLGLATVAEGVERADQHRFLLEAGCTFGQGFFYSRAVPAHDVPRLLERLGTAGPAIGTAQREPTSVG